MSTARDVRAAWERVHAMASGRARRAAYRKCVALMRLRDQWEHREGGIGLKTVASIGLAFLCGVGTMLYFVAPELAKETVVEAWKKVAKGEVLKRGGPTTQPGAEGTASATAAGPATQPVLTHPSVVMGGGETKVAPAVAPAAPPKPKAVLVMNGAKGKKDAGQQGWTTSTGGKTSLVMEGAKPKPTTRPAADGRGNGAVAGKGATKGADPRVATAYAGKTEGQRRVERTMEGGRASAR